MVVVSSVPWTWPQISDAAGALGYSSDKRASELSRLAARSASPRDAPTAAAEAGAARLTLWRDTYGWCPFCHQVQLHLEEKGVEYQVRRAPLSMYRVGEIDPELVQDSPGGLVPTLRVLAAADSLGAGAECVEVGPSAWRVIRGAIDIADFIETSCAGPLLLCLPGIDLNLAKVYLSLAEVVEGHLMGMTKAAVAAALEPEKEGLQREAKESDRWLLSTLEDVDLAVQESGGPFFFGAVFSVVDMAFAPWIDRAAAMLSFLRKVDVRCGGRFPGVQAWLAAMEARPAHRALRLDDETHVRIAASAWISTVGLVPRHVLRTPPPSWAVEDGDCDPLAAAEAAQCLAACHAGVVALAWGAKNSTALTQKFAGFKLLWEFLILLHSMGVPHSIS
mmetsp:Transcript_36468/g.117007  ORF Transcript_36468/g.117007 Transcript_36468/m.117007 type:complete len:391 (+) Transcript_36468:143-1315(+)